MNENSAISKIANVWTISAALLAALIYVVRFEQAKVRLESYENRLDVVERHLGEVRKNQTDIEIAVSRLSRENREIQGYVSQAGENIELLNETVKNLRSPTKR